MGVKGLFQFLKRFQKNVYIADYIKNKSVGIDIFWFIHQSKGNLFTLQTYLQPIIRNSREVHCVLDGHPSVEKKQKLEQEHKKRKELRDSINSIEAFLKYPFHRITYEDKCHIYAYLKELKIQAWQPSPEYVDIVETWLKEKDCILHYAEQEADDLLIELEQKKIIELIITNDSDLLIMGSNLILRPINAQYGRVIDRLQVCDILGFTAQQWSDFMYLCRHMENKDVVVAYSLISVYKDLEYVFEKYEI